MSDASSAPSESDVTASSAESAVALCGVITGDIVGSTELPADERRELYDIMRETAQRVEEHFADAIALPVDIFAGDTWQILLSDPPMTLRVAMFYRAIIRSQMTKAPPGTSSAGRDRRMDTRLALAIGPIDFVPAERVSEGEGEAFRLSGRTLKQMSKHVRMGFRCSDAEREQTWNAVAHLLDAIVTGQWTAAKARAVSGALLGWPQQRIAELWPEPIKQATVSNHLREASWPAIEETLQAFESIWRISDYDYSDKK